MRIDSQYWDPTLGVCTKHNLPQIPCPACLSGDGDEDLFIQLSEVDRLHLDFGDRLADMVPSNLRSRVAANLIEVFG